MFGFHRVLSTDNQFMNDFHNFVVVVVVVDDDVLMDFHYINRLFLILAGFGIVYQIHIFLRVISTCKLL